MAIQNDLKNFQNKFTKKHYFSSSASGSPTLQLIIIKLYTFCAVIFFNSNYLIIFSLKIQLYTNNVNYCPLLIFLLGLPHSQLITLKVTFPILLISFFCVLATGVIFKYLSLIKVYSILLILFIYMTSHTDMKN